MNTRESEKLFKSRMYSHMLKSDFCISEEQINYVFYLVSSTGKAEVYITDGGLKIWVTFFDSEGILKAKVVKIST